MKINDSMRLLDVKAAFQEKFPYLKLEFYRMGHRTGEGSPARWQLVNSSTIGEVRTIHKTGHISIDGHQKVGTLERNFARQYGLNVQVFRRSANIWLQTSSTDDWTLAEQNRKGKHSVELMRMAAAY